MTYSLRSKRKMERRGGGDQREKKIKKRRLETRKEERKNARVQSPIFFFYIFISRRPPLLNILRFLRRLHKLWIINSTLSPDWLSWKCASCGPFNHRNNQFWLVCDFVFLRFLALFFVPCSCCRKHCLRCIVLFLNHSNSVKMEVTNQLSESEDENIINPITVAVK